MTDFTPSVTEQTVPAQTNGASVKRATLQIAWPAGRPGPLRSAQRARCLRRRLHRPDEGREVAPDRQGRSGHAREPDASRRRRRRSADGRRRRRAGADSGPLLPRGDGEAGHRTAARRPLWRRPLVHAAGRGAARAYQRDHRRVGAVRGPAAASASATCRSTIPRCPRRPTSPRPNRSIARSSSAVRPRSRTTRNTRRGSICCAR